MSKAALNSGKIRVERMQFVTQKVAQCVLPTWLFLNELQWDIYVCIICVSPQTEKRVYLPLCETEVMRSITIVALHQLPVVHSST